VTHVQAGLHAGHYAADNGYLDIVMFLHGIGVDFNIADEVSRRLNVVADTRAVGLACWALCGGEWTPRHRQVPVWDRCRLQCFEPGEKSD
jgi:hypothetical protein